ncbi:hypothetical protein MMAD_30320 [Mycolicibacterium madagascariense]|uniref:Uncharacterized protein n=1 Tax=Mycolicibacterium madagascariense TaxID=212765 RepID=A0A7I7XHQ4_9MYCO|nr:hypothetical protein MMAD_30320 [Mycolicibacterium madagascariense]
MSEPPAGAVVELDPLDDVDPHAVRAARRITDTAQARPRILVTVRNPMTGLRQCPEESAWRVTTASYCPVT